MPEEDSWRETNVATCLGFRAHPSYARLVERVAEHLDITIAALLRKGVEHLAETHCKEGDPRLVEELLTAGSKIRTMPSRRRPRQCSSSSSQAK